MKSRGIRILMVLLTFGVFAAPTYAQKTQIRGFANVDARYTEADESGYFYLGEQDLFITSQITNKISFLGESVFKFSPNSPTSFNVSMERVIINYNYAGNHSVLLGKHHTPFSHWNDRYHHGRVFFPTVDRPLMFSEGLLEVHTTGIALQGFNLGKYRMGYQLMLGNGIGSSDLQDDNQSKSWTADLHAKPKKGMKFGLTGYMDRFSSDASDHHSDDHEDDSTDAIDISQLAGGAYFRYFKGKYELLSEAHLINNENDSTGKTSNSSFYAYMGYRLKDKWVPYVKFDQVSVAQQELFFSQGVKTQWTAGLRYEFSYLAMVKFEYNRFIDDGAEDFSGFYLQFAVGF